MSAATTKVPDRGAAGVAPAVLQAEFQRRRDAVCAATQRPIVLLGPGVRDRNLPGYGLPHRASSDVLYLTGCGEVGAGAILVDGRLELFLPVAEPGDALWHGPAPSLESRAEGTFAAVVRPRDELEDRVRELLADGPLATVASADPAANETLAWWSGRALEFGKAPGDDDLVDALCALRRRKSEPELAAMREAVRVSTQAHLAVAAACRAGVHERALAGLFEAVLANQGCTPGYGTILTQHGEILHCHDQVAALADGSLLLVDAGAELGPSWGPGNGYGADLTRTWPVSGRFDPRQRAAYDAVHAAWQAAVDLLRPGVRYRAAHDAAALVLARFMRDEGILRISPEAAVERGAHGLFFPHGVGHLLGLDVHDLEAYGDRAAYAPGLRRPDVFGSRFLRLDMPLEPGFVVTIEPGFYAVPAILHDPVLRERFGADVDWGRAEAWLGFGGIRIEDDVCVTETGAEVLSADLPRSASGVEAAVGVGADWADLLGLR